MTSFVRKISAILQVLLEMERNLKTELSQKRQENTMNSNVVHKPSIYIFKTLQIVSF